MEFILICIICVLMFVVTFVGGVLFTIKQVRNHWGSLKYFIINDDSYYRALKSILLS